MNILYYYWGENSSRSLVPILQQKLGYHLDIVSDSFEDHDDDPVFHTMLLNKISQNSYDCIFSFDFFPLIAKAAKEADIPYISWIYDMPHLALCSPSANLSVNHIFVFDYDLYNKLSILHPDAHIYHMPLAVDIDRMLRILGEPPAHLGSNFDVTFVGSLYEKNLYDEIHYLPEYLWGYLDGIMNAQSAFYGSNIIEELLIPTITDELKQHVKLDIPSSYCISYKELFADIINKKITSTERIQLLSSISSLYSLTLFTGSNPNLVPDATMGGIVDYMTKMPIVFRTSSININITLRSITSGIPLRAIDVMGAGGFLLSTYQPELAEFFTDGEDCVLFHSENDMLCKIDYYLSHEKERNEIACNGFRKTAENFSYEKKIAKIFSTVFNESFIN